jgi:anaerobic magnesium-protoporphyrin IX monomethyl ester cyclase
VNVTLVSPPALIDPGDIMTTGIHRFPLLLAQLAAVLDRHGHAVTVVDSVGLAPRAVRPRGKLWVHGLTPDEAALRMMEKRPNAVFVMADTVTAHDAVLDLIRAIRNRQPALMLGVLENTQSVTGYSLRRVLPDFFSAGASHVVTGESEERVVRLIENPTDWLSIDGVYGLIHNEIQGRAPESVIEKLDDLPFPDWSKIPLEGHWSLGYAHGPTERNHLPLLTSRGCPYPCAFCVVPETSLGRWRKRSAVNVVQEIVQGINTRGVREFHVEDLNPTLDEERLRALSSLILEQKLDITWRIVSGGKLDPLKKKDTFELMAASGCDYFSFSPESGSPRVLAAMNKSFDHDLALQSVREMARVGIRTQACFVIGFPGETDEDLGQTQRYVKALVKARLDETAFFVAAPLPGSALAETVGERMNPSALTFSPPNGPRGSRLRWWRRQLYGTFLVNKTLRRPNEILAQAWRFIRRRFKTKMEMAPRRALQLRWTAARCARAKTPT